jgi:hypothetical protein
MLGVNEKQAKKSAKNGITSRRETSALWEQRHDVHKGCVVPASELRAQVAEAVKARRMRKAETRTNHNYLKMSRKQLENFLEQERRHKLGASITRFAVSPEESDEEEANRKRENVIENLARHNRKRSKKRKEQRKCQKNSKKAAEEGTAHIDEMWNTNQKLTDLE